jgi:phosphatidylglycerol:prolipoprotein diacylglycerol transferase
MMPADLYPGWGIRPVLFRIAGLPVPAYEVFVLLGLVAGALVFWRLRRGEPRMGEPTAVIAIAALAGGALGAKVLEWAFNMPALARVDSLAALIAGRTIIGGFVGGSIAVIVVKRHYGIRERRGNLFAPAIALGLAVGRLGCFFRGCCYGEATTLPWGVDFGDHVMRHPTQLYESAFALLLFAVLVRLRTRVTTPGRLLTVYRSKAPVAGSRTDTPPPGQCASQISPSLSSTMDPMDFVCKPDGFRGLYGYTVKLFWMGSKRSRPSSVPTHSRP